MSAQNALAVIIGRAGSKGLPGKNALPLAGRPMVAHSILHALAASSIEKVVVSTDGDAIADAARQYGVDVVIRPPELASDQAAIDPAVRHAVESTDPHGAFQTIVVLYANVPVRPDDLIDRAVETLLATGADSVQSYCDVGKYHPMWMVNLDENRRVSPYVPGKTFRRQDLPPLHIPDGGVIAVRRAPLFTVIEGDPHAFLGADRRGIETRPGEVIDVDTAGDFHVAESLLTS